jgi:hypothetical protein
MLPESTIRWLIDQNRNFADVVRSADGITTGA